MTAIELGGQRFGRLIVVQRQGSQCNKAMWLCQCDCGNQTVVAGVHLRNRAQKSCGCLKNELARLRMTRHGLRSRNADVHPLYHSWLNIRQRCSNPAHPGFKWYGIRGIKMCERWNDFAAFLADVGPKPLDPSLTLDRINNDGNYEPGNVRWATKHEQCMNRRPKSRWGEGRTTP